MPKTTILPLATPSGLILPLMLEPLSPVMIPLVTVKDQLQRKMQGPVLAPLHVPSKVSNEGPASLTRRLSVFTTGVGATGGLMASEGCGAGATERAPETGRAGLATLGVAFVDGAP